MTSILQIILMVLDLAWFIILAHVIMSWLINFRVLNLQQAIVAQIWQGINRLVNPVYSRIRQFLPNTGGLDFAPLISLFAVYALRIIIQNNLYNF
jgi:YggT family protein